MPLKFKHQNPADIPAEFKPLYLERDGAWCLDVHGAVDPAALESLTAERDALHARLSVIQIDQAVVAEATKRGLRPTAVPDVMARARHVFGLLEGVPTPLAEDGKTVRLGKDGKSPLSVPEWLDALVSEAPHLFEPNTGAGAAASQSASVTAPPKNPFCRATWNVTEQMRLLRVDPILAAKLKAAA